MRENTASSRQHAPRFAVRSILNHPERASDSSREELPLLSASPSKELSTTSPNDAAHTAATGGDESHGKHLLTVHEVANLLQVPVSWVYGRTRKRSLERIPSYRLGKYWRFRQDEVLMWVEAQQRDPHAT
ncbi:MAG: helix-turn-helix domain-containing protein [Candidatus Acidiferrales bacterium]